VWRPVGTDRPRCKVVIMTTRYDVVRIIDLVRQAHDSAGFWLSLFQDHTVVDPMNVRLSRLVALWRMTRIRGETIR